MSKKIVIGSDHAGFDYKQEIVSQLKSAGYEVIDVGCYDKNSCDYPIIAQTVAKRVASGEFEKGILICGTGIGMSIAANKVKGIRAALCPDEFSARATREHNDSNILCLGARVIDVNLARKIVEIWLETPFSNLEKHKKRISMIEGDK